MCEFVLDKNSPWRLLITWKTYKQYACVYVYVYVYVWTCAGLVLEKESSWLPVKYKNNTHVCMCMCMCVCVWICACKNFLLDYLENIEKIRMCVCACVCVSVCLYIAQIMIFWVVVWLPGNMCIRACGTCIGTRTHAHINTCIRHSARTYIHAYTIVLRAFSWPGKDEFTLLNVNMYVYMYVCMYVCMYACKAIEFGKID